MNLMKATLVFLDGSFFHWLSKIYCELLICHSRGMRNEIELDKLLELINLIINEVYIYSIV